MSTLRKCTNNFGLVINNNNNKKTRKQQCGAGELAEQLRALAALPGDPGLLLNTHMGPHNYRIQHSLLTSWDTRHACDTHTNTPYTKNKINKFLKPNWKKSLHPTRKSNEPLPQAKSCVHEYTVDWKKPGTGRNMAWFIYGSKIEQMITIKEKSSAGAVAQW